MRILTHHAEPDDQEISPIVDETDSTPTPAPEPLPEFPTKELLKHFFEPRQNRFIPDMPFGDYKALPAVNASLLKEATPIEMLDKLRASAALPEADVKVLEASGADASEYLARLAAITPRMMPRSFVVAVKAIDGKATDKQREIVDAVRSKPVDSREFNGVSLQSCIKNGWVTLQTKEVMESPETEAMKASRAEAFAIGDATHKAILEPHFFDADEWHQHWQLCPTKSLVSSAAKELMRNDPRRLITPEIVDIARRCRDAAWSHKECARLLEQPGRRECSAEVWDAELQVMRKARFDFLPDDTGEHVIDVKTDRSRLLTHQFKQSCKNNNYGMSMSYYLDVLAILEQRRRPGAYLIGITKSDRYMARLFEMDESLPDVSFITRGREFYEEQISKFVLSYMEDVWEAYENEPAVLITY